MHRKEKKSVEIIRAEKKLKDQVKAHLFSGSLRNSCFAPELRQNDVTAVNPMLLPNVEVYVTMVDEKIIGCIAVEEMNYSPVDQEKRESCHLIHSFCVTAAKRNTGVGQMLMQYVISKYVLPATKTALYLAVACPAELSKTCCVQATVVLRERYDKLVTFYQRMGFSEIPGADEKYLWMKFGASKDSERRGRRGRRRGGG